jgi:antitoxin HigA-1
MSVSAFARKLGVSRQTLHAVLAERSGVSAEMALRLGALLGDGAQLWVVGYQHHV